MQTSKTFSLLVWEAMGGVARRVAEDARRRPVFYFGLGTSLGFHVLILAAFAGWTVARVPVSKGSFRDAEVPFQVAEEQPEEAAKDLEALDPTDQDESEASEAWGEEGAGAGVGVAGLAGSWVEAGAVPK